MANAPKAASALRGKLRALTAKRFGPTRRELLALMWDVYELAMIQEEDKLASAINDDMMSLLGGGGNSAKVLKVSADQFDEIVTKDSLKKGKITTDVEAPGQYL